jgi:hypothetical protein
MFIFNHAIEHQSRIVSGLVLALNFSFTFAVVPYTDAYTTQDNTSAAGAGADFCPGSGDHFAGSGLIP